MKFSEARKIISELCKGYYFQLLYEEDHFSGGNKEIRCGVNTDTFGEMKTYSNQKWEAVVNELKSLAKTESLESIGPGEMDL